MPAWLPKYQPDEKDLRQESGKEIKVRETAHSAAQSWYDGEMPNTIPLQENRKTGAKIDHNVKLNLFAKRMDRRRDFLFKLFPELQIDAADEADQDDDVVSPDDTTAEDWLEKAWDWNKAHTLWGLALLNGGFTGQVYMQTLEPRPNRDKYPRCILLSNIITVWQADDVDTHLWYEKYYRVGSTEYRQDIVDLQAVGEADRGWRIYTYKRAASTMQSVADDTKWMKVDEAEWSYDLGPIVTWQHWPRASRCYGAGEFGDIALNTSVNRILSLGSKVLHNHGYPKTVGTGFSAKKLEETSVDGFMTIDSAEAKVYNLEMQSDLSALLNLYKELKEGYNSQGRTVDIEGGPADFANITNLAIKVSFMPQDDANEILKRQYGYGIIETSKRLQMLGKQAYQTDPIIQWKPALPESKTEVALVVEAEDKLQLASKETQATQLGLDWMQEQERMLNEQKISKVRRFTQQDVAAAQNNFNAAPSLQQLMGKRNGMMMDETGNSKFGPNQVRGALNNG